MECSRNFARQGNTFSSYKHTNTFKCLIAVTPNGGACFVSDLFEGDIDDVKGNLHSHNKYCLKCSKYAKKEIFRLKKYSILPNKFFSESKEGLRSKFKSPAIGHLD